MGLRIGGLATGLDTNALVDSLLALERRPLELAQQRKADLETQRSLFRDLNTKLLALRDAAAALDNRSSGLTGASVEEEFLAYSATSSNEGVVTASATGEASPGNVDVIVNALAQASRDITTQFSSDTDIVANEGETLTIDYGGESPIAITIAAGGASLVDIRGLINQDVNNDGSVQAEVIDDGSGFRLVISGQETGLANDVSITTDITNGASPFLDAGLTQDASDAQLEVFGLAVTRASNTVTDLIPGVTLELNATTPDAGTPQEVATEISVAIDTETIQAELENFLSVYNEIVDFVTEQSEFSETTEEAGPLSGDSTLRSVQLSLQSILTGAPVFDGNPLQSLSQIGLALGSDGRLALDADELETALSDDPLAVRELLSGNDTTDGIATAINRQVDLFLNGDPDAAIPSEGILQARDEGIETRIDALDTTIERIEDRLARREELLVAQFTQLEQIISNLNQQGNALSGLQSR